MSSKTRGLILTVGGTLLLVVAAAADAFGLGGHPGFGWKQILGTLAGLGAAGMGVRDLRR